MKKKISLIAYYAILLEEFRDQLTLIIILNLIPIILASKLQNYIPSYYLERKYQDPFQLFTQQFSWVDFCEVLFYIYIGALILHLGATKVKRYELYIFLSFLIACSSTFVWTIPKWNSIFQLLKNGNFIFALMIFFQTLTVVLFGKEIMLVLKKKLNKPNFNHS